VHANYSKTQSTVACYKTLNELQDYRSQADYKISIYIFIFFIECINVIKATLSALRAWYMSGTRNVLSHCSQIDIVL